LQEAKILPKHSAWSVSEIAFAWGFTEITHFNNVGYYQEKGKPGQIIRKGDIIKCSPGVQHWHGASPDSEFAHLVVAPDIEKGEVTWLQRVTDEEYHSLK